MTVAHPLHGAVELSVADMWTNGRERIRVYNGELKLVE